MSRRQYLIKRYLTIKTLCLLFLFASSVESAELMVQAQLDPYIAVVPSSPTVQITSTRVGDFNGVFNFVVESNTAAVSVHAVVTKLYKDTNPNNNEVKPIDVNRSAGVDLMPVSAEAVGGSDLNAAFTATTTVNKPTGTFEAYKTEQVDMQSTQQGIFNQDIELNVTWTRDETVRPAGVYGGYVQLFVSAIP